MDRRSSVRRLIPVTGASRRARSAGPASGPPSASCTTGRFDMTLSISATAISTHDIPHGDRAVKPGPPTTIGEMSTRLWDRAALVPVRAGERHPEIVALPAGLPSIEELFTFMRDAERRFETLKMRIEERTYGARGAQVVTMDIAVRHPGQARVVTTERSTKARRQPRALDHRRPDRPDVLGGASPGHEPTGQEPAPWAGSRAFPGSATVYEPITSLPMETLAELFVHPAGYCQNVLATGDCWISGTERIAGREAIVVECDHPRAVEQTVDRPDYHVQVAADRIDGFVLRLVESVANEVTRVAEVIHVDPDAALPPTTFDFEFPEGTTLLY